MMVSISLQTFGGSSAITELVSSKSTMSINLYMMICAAVGKIYDFTNDWSVLSFGLTLSAVRSLPQPRLKRLVCNLPQLHWER